MLTTSKFNGHIILTHNGHTYIAETLAELEQTLDLLENQARINSKKKPRTRPNTGIIITLKRLLSKY